MKLLLVANWANVSIISSLVSGKMGDESNNGLGVVGVECRSESTVELERGEEERFGRM